MALNYQLIVNILEEKTIIILFVQCMHLFDFLLELTIYKSEEIKVKL